MSLLKSIIRYFEQRKIIKEIYDDLGNHKEVLLAERLEVFAEKATPKFAEIGLKNWNGKYIWFSDFNEYGVKHVIEYHVFKGFGGSFSYGNCFDFVPTISNGKWINHKTDKSTKNLFFNRFEGWQKSLDRDSLINPDRISTINGDKFNASLDKVLSTNLPKLQKWFNANETIEQNIDTLIAMTKNPPTEIGTRIISFEYLLAFLYWNKSNYPEAKNWIQKHFEKRIDESEKKMILERLNINPNS
ncbi:hypothetical protein K6T82_09175 [Flavobacterium sp. 17A]|uniref:Uncharacterized protein n=1 Tax=Flavobacterium potami TaxID=2872310 RepID=A0A9X1H916_9FLAO|nr:hypothetical protein [Flavobacterium potami]MBZ4034938.1 hypothetical protein [Flavobacterium potami]